MNDYSPISIEAASEVDEAAQDSARKTKRKKMFALLAAGIAVVGAATVGYETLIASNYVETDNAYVGANSAEVTPQIAGVVATVLVDETQQVKAGQILVTLDDTDARLQLASAEAALQSAERRVRGYFANDSSLAAQVAAQVADQTRAAADVAAAQANVTKAKIDLDRRVALAASGSVSGDEVTTARNAYATATANLTSSRAAQAQAGANRQAAVGSRQVNRVLIAGTDVEDNPEVAAARATRDSALVNLERTVIRAPVDGVVSKRQVQVGQRIQAGSNLMVVVPVEQAYVDANFKENQLENVRPGQKVTLTSDLYGGSVKFNGRVSGFSGGTGSAFAIVPAQNATGNWIKVVQRLPVRITLDPKQLREHPLRVGLSMEAEIHLNN